MIEKVYTLASDFDNAEGILSLITESVQADEELTSFLVITASESVRETLASFAHCNVLFITENTTFGEIGEVLDYSEIVFVLTSDERVQQMIAGRNRIGENLLVIFLTDTDTRLKSVSFSLAQAARCLSSFGANAREAWLIFDVWVRVEAAFTSEIRDKTSPRGAESKAERDAEIVKLHDAGLSLRQIHKQMTASGHKVSFGTISSVVKVYKKGD